MRTMETIRCRSEVSGHRAHNARQGVHARKVMESYQTWLGEGPELSVLRILGLFDRPADEKALAALLKPPAIPGLTESLTDLSLSEWRTILAKLRRAKLLAREDPHNPGYLDTHPLVREYFGEQLRDRQADAWKECNRRLYGHQHSKAAEVGIAGEARRSNLRTIPRAKSERIRRARIATTSLLTPNL